MRKTSRSIVCVLVSFHPSCIPLTSTSRRPCPHAYAHVPLGLVPTGLTAPLIAICPAEYITPTSTIVRAVQQFLDDETLTGQVAECSGEAIHHRSQPEWGDDMAEYVMGPGLRALMKASRVRIEEDK